MPFANNFNPDASYQTALLTSRLANGIAIMIPVTWYHFILIFIGEEEKRKNVLKTIYIFSVCLSFFIFTPWFVSDIAWIAGFYSAVAGPFHYLFSLLFFSIVPLSFFDLIKKWKTLSAREKGNLKGFAITVGIVYIGGSMTFLPAYGINFPQYGLFLMPIYPFAMAYFLIRKGLFDVEELAQAAHRDKLTAIGVLAASINHEVRNPLFVIKGLAENWMERQKENVFANEKTALENACDAMKRSIDQADRAMDIIKRLSLFAKTGIESEIKFEAVKLADVIENILPLIRYELAAHNITLTREIPKDLPDVYADRRYLEEIFFNLIVNAAQAIKANFQSENSKANWTSPGILQCKENRSQDKETGRAGEIRMSTGLGTRDSSFLNERVASPEARVPASIIITIQDNGPGIPEEKIKDVFRPFYTTKAEGTGLGLYITKQLIEKIKGRIDVHSEMGCGTKFTVVLPANTPVE